MKEETKNQTEKLLRRLSERRRELKKSQTEIANIAGITQPSYARIEKVEGIDIRLSTLISISNALNMDVAVIPRECRDKKVNEVLNSETDNSINIGWVALKDKILFG